MARMPCDHRAREWSDTAASQDTTRMASHHQKLGRGKERFYPQLLRGNMALLTPWFQNSSLPNCERINVWYFKPPLCYGSPRKLIQYLPLPSFSLPPTFSAEIFSISYDLDIYAQILKFAHQQLMHVFSYSRIVPSLRDILVPEVKKIFFSPLPLVYWDCKNK